GGGRGGGGGGGPPRGGPRRPAGRGARAVPACRRSSADRSRASVVSAGGRLDGRRRRRPSGVLAPIARRVGEPAERQRAEVGELAAAEAHELAERAADRRRKPEAHT